MMSVLNVVDCVIISGLRVITDSWFLSCLNCLIVTSLLCSINDHIDGSYYYFIFLVYIVPLNGSGCKSVVSNFTVFSS